MTWSSRLEGSSARYSYPTPAAACGLCGWVRCCESEEEARAAAAVHGLTCLWLRRPTIARSTS